MNAFIITIIMIIFNYFFSGDIKKTSDKYKLDITPAPFTFAIWGIIYSLLLYISIKHSKEMDNIIILYLVSCILNVLWLYTWGKNIVLSNIIITLLTIVLFIILKKSIDALQLIDPKSNIIIITFAIYSTWVLIASLFNTGSVMKYNMNIKDNIIIPIILIYIITSLLLSILLYKNVYVTISMISVFIWALIGII